MAIEPDGLALLDVLLGLGVIANCACSLEFGDADGILVGAKLGGLVGFSVAEIVIDSHSLNGTMSQASLR